MNSDLESQWREAIKRIATQAQYEIPRARELACNAVQLIECAIYEANKEQGAVRPRKRKPEVMEGGSSFKRTFHEQAKPD